MNASPTVLIGFADALSAPEVLWSLKDAGFRVLAFAKRGTHPALLKSRFAKVLFVTDPEESATAALADLRRIVERDDSPILMPLDDISLWLASELAKLTDVRMAGAVGHQAEMALDKRLQFQAAQTAGFLVPETTTLELPVDLDKVSRFPIILKPALAARLNGESLGRGNSEVIADRKELLELGKRVNWMEPLLAQPLLSGVGEGLFGIALPNTVVCWSGHRRIRMMNPSGSGASACVSQRPSQEIQRVAETFLMEIRWSGMFMIELLRTADDRLWFMELNGRSWGSMALARRMGFDYPAWTVRTSIDPAFVPPSPPQRPPVVCRHLGRELLRLAFVVRGSKSRCNNGWPSRVDAFRQVLRIRGQECWYNWNIQDPTVFWAETWQTLQSPFRRTPLIKARPSFTTRVYGRLLRLPVRYHQGRARTSGRVATLLKHCNRVLFLCYGNINRSALAEQHLKQLLGSSLAISSCGFHAQDRRPLDPQMRSLAQDFGVYFSLWSSRKISAQLVNEADLIFAMEVSHLVRLFREYPQTRHRAFLLSCATSPKTIPLEIDDPYGGTAEAYKRCIRDVTYATTAISNIIKGSDLLDVHAHCNSQV